LEDNWDGVVIIKTKRGEEEMNYQVDFKCFGFMDAKNPRNAKKIIEDILNQHCIYLVYPSFRTKKLKEEEKK
jgi:hypothetical protein